MSAERGEVKVVQRRPSDLVLRRGTSGTNYQAIAKSIKGKDHSSDSFDNLPQTRIGTESMHGLSSFAAKLSLLLTRYKTYLNDHKPWYFKKIWLLRLKQVNNLLALLQGTKISNNDQLLVDECRNIMNTKPLYLLGIFSRMHLPKILNELFEEHKKGKVNFCWAFFELNSQTTPEFIRLTEEYMQLYTELESERTARDQLTKQLSDLEHLLDDRVELKREDFSSIMALFESRPRSRSPSFQENHNYLLVEYKKLDSDYKKLDTRNKQLSAEYETLKKDYEQICFNYKDAQDQLSLWQNKEIEKLIPYLSDDHIAKSALDIINNQKKEIAEKVSENTSIRQTNSKRQDDKMKLMRELTQKNEEIAKLNCSLSQKDETILQLQKQVEELQQNSDYGMKR